MSGYFLHTKVLKLLFSFSLDTFISFNENFLTFFYLLFFPLNKKENLSVGKECPASTEQVKLQLCPPPAGILAQWSPET